MQQPLMSELGHTIMVGSGGIGTSLRRSGTSGGEPVELMNLRHPDTVRVLHEAYCAAGSQILIANTFAANPLLLEEAGVVESCAAINQAGVRLAQEAADGRMVWASVGPLSLGLRHDDYTEAQLLHIYKVQCEALAEADAIVLETFTDPREARAALDAATQTGRPVVFQIGNTGRGRFRQHRIDALIDLATRAQVMALGTNCQHPADILDVVRYLATRTSLPITASPNAGNPRMDRGLIHYDFSPDDLAAVGRDLATSGAAVIGGCCGNTPEHIARLAAAISGQPVAARPSASVVTAARAPGAPAVPSAINKVRQLVSGNAFVVSVEVRASRKQSPETIVAGAAKLARAGADLFDVPDNPGATVGRDAMVIAATLQRELHVPSICHRSVTQSNLLQIHSSLLGCWDLGLEGLLAVTGDPPSMGHLGTMAHRVSDLKSSVELLRLVKALREGRMINGEDVADPPDFCTGCAVGRPSDGQIRWLNRKVEAGAEYVFSQPVFSLDAYCRLRDRVADLPIRFFPGVMPLTSRAGAEFLAGGRIPGITIPETLLDAFAKQDSKADQERFGLDMTEELACRIAEDAAGIYLIMPFGKNCYVQTARIVTAVKQAAAGRTNPIGQGGPA